MAAITISVLYAATWLGLVADGEALTRQYRAASAETLSITVSSLIDEAEPEVLEQTLAILRERNPGMLSIGVRASDGSLLIDVGQHDAQWSRGPHEQSTENELVVPVWQAGEPWGNIELSFTPLRAAGWRAYAQDPGLRLAAFFFIVCTPLFAFYLRRMLLELDPSRAVPARVRTAYDTLTEGMLVLDRQGAIVLANKSTISMLAVQESQLLGRSPSEFDWRDLADKRLAANDLPWQVAMATRRLQRDVHLH
ncbi:MAG: PAS domain-containing protein, partial [Propionivibrio sp.]